MSYKITNTERVGSGIDGIKHIEKTLSKAATIGSLSDGYHSFDELYYFRMMYNAMLVSEWNKQGIYETNKSKRHHDGELCFGGGWFIVTAMTPFGLISNHYDEKYFHLFDCEETETSIHEYDGHWAHDVTERLSLTIMNRIAGGE